MPTLPIHTVHPSRHLVPRRVSAFIDAVADAFRGLAEAGICHGPDFVGLD